MSRKASVSLQVSTLPQLPGVYQYFDQDNKLLYVGKAKNLKKRVASYFSKTHDNARTRLLVKRINTIKHIVVPTETDALLLENNLIKQYQPRYNVMWKDDKSYPWLCIKNERFPRVFSTRNMRQDGSEYYGPYTSMKTVHTLLELIKTLYPLRTCNYDLSSAKIASGKYKVCLEYHLENCAGPCEAKFAEEAYQANINAIRNILKGNFKASLKQFKLQMAHYASELAFEKAQRIKEKIEVLENYQSKSTIVNPRITNVDVFSIVSDESYAYINYLQVAYGAIVRSHTLELKKQLDESDLVLLQIGVFELRRRFQSQAKTLYLPFAISVGESLKIHLPKAGDKRKLLELSIRNAKAFRIDRLKQAKVVDPHRHENRIMAQMQKDLRLAEEPRLIECFDNSNIQGSNPVAACVVFKNGKPHKASYRKYHIKTVEGPNDFASMQEVVYRRYKRLLDEQKPLPQLILIDGGKGQLNAALKSLEVLGLRGKIAVIGIAKRLEELFFPEDPIPLYLDKKSETLKVLQQLRNEAHRFGITFHRDLRSKASLQTVLETIPGIGEKTVLKLLATFKSPSRIAKASFEELEMQIGSDKAQKIITHYQSVL